MHGVQQHWNRLYQLPGKRCGRGTSICCGAHKGQAPRMTWSFFYRCSCGLDLNACHVQTFSFRAITTEDFRKQGPSTAQVEARWEQECCALSWFNLYFDPCKTGLQGCSGTFKTKQQKKQRRIKFPFAAYLCHIQKL